MFPAYQDCPLATPASLRAYIDRAMLNWYFSYSLTLVRAYLVAFLLLAL